MSKTRPRVRPRRLVAYRIWPELNTGDMVNMPPRKLLWTLSENNRWREALDRAAQLLETVAEQMNTYVQYKPEQWQANDEGIVFQDNLDEVIELQDRLDDLRSNF
jgi:flagellar basal body rod protein FlgC